GFVWAVPTGTVPAPNTAPSWAMDDHPPPPTANAPRPWPNVWGLAPHLSQRLLPPPSAVDATGEVSPRPTRTSCASCRGASVGEGEQRVDVKVLLHQVGEQVQAPFPSSSKIHTGRLAAEHLGQEGGTKSIPFQGAVPCGAANVPRPGTAQAFLRPADRDLPVVHRVAAQRRVEGLRRGPTKGLLGAEVRTCIQQPQPLHVCPGLGLHPVLVGQVRPEPLDPATDAEQWSATAGV